MRTLRALRAALDSIGRHAFPRGAWSTLGVPAALAAIACTASAQGDLRIYVLDVEQGASTLIVSPAGNTLLVDSGKDHHGIRVSAKMLEAGVTRIDHYVTTHYHEDHYGGIDELVGAHHRPVVNAYDRGDKAGQSGDRYDEYHAAVGHRAQQLSRGQTIPLDPEMVVQCIASSGAVINEPNPTPGTDENDNSIALLISFGNFRYFVGGDIEESTEGKIAARDLVLDVDVYSANHHGSDTSSSLGFMHDLLPSVVLISNGNNFKYKHPRQLVLDTYASLTPAPTVFQTNKYLKGGEGGNVVDAHIADPETIHMDGTILVTVSGTTGQYVVTYPGSTHTFGIKPRGTGGLAGGGAGPALAALGLVIESLLPDPDGNESQLEEVTLRNRGTTAVQLAGWTLRDASVNALPLTGQIAPGASLSILRSGGAITLNNDGDTITLFSPGNQPQDSYTYTGSSEGIRITTGH